MFTLLKKPRAGKLSFAGARKAAWEQYRRKNLREFWKTVTTAWLKGYGDAEERQTEDLQMERPLLLHWLKMYLCSFQKEHMGLGIDASR